MKTSQKPISVYIHWPYCLSKCPYCDFASSVCSVIDEDKLFQGYQRDIKLWLGNRPVDTVFFGGGTPSLMSPRLVDKILNQIGQLTSFTGNPEITIEANPDAIDICKMRQFHNLGINRLSVGVQSLVDSDLRFLGRKHTVKKALTCVREAQTVFDRINVDLIYARPGQTLQSWADELKTALDLGLTHYSLYQLTIEDNTVFGRKKIKPLSDDAAARLYQLTDEIMNTANLPAYEVSNYAKSGEECRHNLAYWTGEDYVGIGPAAHGRVGLKAIGNPRGLSEWLDKGPTIENLTNSQKQMERLLMGLRLRQKWYPKNGLNSSIIKRFVQDGFLEENNVGIRPTLSGTLILDKLILDLMPN
ncbi:MAG: radical SAM family heme chaperone HemW [Alphaproteobacteria bacterium]|nr:radical SAM family heme chaperone HemW [Alphaproteobacteria bacterium]